MRLVDHGWLEVRDDLLQGVTIEGVFVGPQWPTRREEYSFARENAIGSTCLDLATGYNPEIHLFALMMGRAGWDVVGMDLNEGVCRLPEHPRVHYIPRDCRFTGLPDASYDYVTCISSLEHMDEPTREMVVGEMIRTARKRILVTADHFPTLHQMFGFKDAPKHEPKRPLHPPVYYAIVDMD